MTLTHFALVFLGGGIGAVGRHGVGLFTLRTLGVGFPFGTFAVNVLGSLAMGLMVGYFAQRVGAGSQNLRLFFATGVLGGFTTFSAFSLDIANLWEKGALGQAFGYTVGTVVVCISAVFVGLLLARNFAT